MVAKKVGLKAALWASFAVISRAGSTAAPKAFSLAVGTDHAQRQGVYLDPFSFFIASFNHNSWVVEEEGKRREASIALMTQNKQ